ncbi:MAG TPA: glycoside hydrolase family 3 N-terminal domain-containing protein [Candidatus Sulfotelmatobacter sp.]|nr:glycoside hydrolase family 3 N-terminal domain-containing protein [Candidatus Sulfotelmatobacter sp.]
MLRNLAWLLPVFTLLGSAAEPRAQYKEAPAQRLERVEDGWAENTLKSLSLEEKVGQLFMIRLRVEYFNGRSPTYFELRNNIRRYHIGAVAMSAPPQGRAHDIRRRYDVVTLLNQLQLEGKIPLLVAGDFERGVLPAHLFGTTVFPHAMAFGAAGNLAYAEEFGRITAQESRALGVHWNLFPVADVNSNPANPIIGTRAFGANPEQVGDLVAAYIRGARANGMLTTAKHFPGHGNTATDSHVGVPIVTDDLEHLRAVDLPPFEKAIAAGVDAVMTGHVRVLALDPDRTRVATTSPAVVTGLLKNQLGFKGIVVTDALDMAGLVGLYAQNPGRVAVDAFKAGNDVLTMPYGLDACYRSMLQAVRSGEIGRERLDASVLKILKAKASLGLDKNRVVDVGAIPRLVGNPLSIAAGQRISDASITLVRDNGKVFPLTDRQSDMRLRVAYQRAKVQPPLLVIILCDNLRAEDGRVLERQVRKRAPDATVVYVDPRVAADRSDDVLKAADRAQKVVVAVYVVPSAARTRTVARGQKNSASLPDATATLLSRILARAAEKTAVLAMGTPYLTDDFPTIQNYICTFSNATVSEISAARALFGEIPIPGHMPVNLSKAAGLGTKIDYPARVTKVGSPN